MEEVASLPGKVQDAPTVMDNRRETTAHPKVPAKTTERVETAEAVAVTAAVAAEVIAVIRTGDLFIPAAARAPVKMGDVPTENGTQKKNSTVHRFLK